MPEAPKAPTVPSNAHNTLPGISGPTGSAGMPGSALWALLDTVGRASSEFSSCSTGGATLFLPFSDLAARLVAASSSAYLTRAFHFTVYLVRAVCIPRRRSPLHDAPEAVCVSLGPFRRF